MTRYYPGMDKALSAVENMDAAECVKAMESLYGTDNLKYGASLETVLDELRRQISEDHTDRSNPDEDRFINSMVEIARESRKYR
jgi:hypothetical protein